MKNRITLLLITNSTYYPIFFRHYLPDYYTSVATASFTFEDLELIKPHCIIIDDQPFGENIFSLCIELKKRKLFQQIPLLVITGKLKRSYIQQLTKAGVNGFIREPLEEQDLIERIQEAEKFQEMGKKLGNVAGSTLQAPPKSEASLSSKVDIHKKHILNKNILHIFQQTLKQGKSLSLLAVAIGHKEDNELTDQQIKAMIAKTLKPSDVSLPLGNGKYLLMLNLSPYAEAKRIADSLAKTVTHSLHIDIHIGIASQKKPPYANIHDMIGDAKKALLLAEKKGVFIEAFK